jgi:predicted DNA-binding protein with PD1-like motif
LERGEESVEVLTAFARDQGIRAARVQGIGAFTDAVVGFYDLGRREYDRIPVEEEVEVLAFLGNLGVTDEGPRLHAHATLSRRDGSVLGGHLFEGRAGATLEIFVIEVPGELRRIEDESVGLPLIEL